MSELSLEEAPAHVESTEEIISRVLQSWKVDASNIDIWNRVESAITKTHAPQPFTATTVAELVQQELERRVMAIGNAGVRGWEGISVVTLPEPEPSAKVYYRFVAALTAKPVDVSTVSPTPDAITALSADVARARFALPMSKKGRDLYVAFADPSDADSLEAVSLASDCTVTPLKADRDALAVAIALAYGQALIQADKVSVAEKSARELEIPFVDLSKHSSEKEALATLTATEAERYRALPIKKDGNRLWVAMQNPLNTDAVDAIRLASRCMVQPMFAEPNALADAISRVYGSLVPPKPPYPPTAIAAPAPEPEDDTRHILRETLTELRDIQNELTALRAEVAELRRDRATNEVPHS